MGWFQSLSGFQVRCNSLKLAANAATKIVSIPIGFSSSLQQHRIGRRSSTSCCFNPYRVFKFVATVRSIIRVVWVLSVSIPIGFSSSLQLKSSGMLMPKFSVSIPIGFSSSLQRIRDVLGHRQLVQFQSLSGFQVRCNTFVEPYRKLRVLGFNPYRVFKFVATGATEETLLSRTDKVSIPIGFSSSLQPSPSAATNTRHGKFQSLSGFQVRCNATLSRLPGAAKPSFNPYRVFKFVATRADIVIFRLDLLVSIPIGFSSSLQHKDMHISGDGVDEFQSLSGFQVRCN